MKRFLLVIILITSLLFFGCSSSQEKPSSDSTSNIPAMNVAGEYELTVNITETSCWSEGLEITESVNCNTIITQDGSILEWSTFQLGSLQFASIKSDIKGNEAIFVDITAPYGTNRMKWNATILFTETGFSGTGDMKARGSFACKGKFDITGTKVQ